MVPCGANGGGVSGGGETRQSFVESYESVWDVEIFGGARHGAPCGVGAYSSGTTRLAREDPSLVLNRAESRSRNAHGGDGYEHGGHGRRCQCQRFARLFEKSREIWPRVQRSETGDCVRLETVRVVSGLEYR